MAFVPLAYSLQRVIFVQLCLLSLCAAYPYILIPRYPSSMSNSISKRAFDRAGHGFGFQKRDDDVFDLDDNDVLLEQNIAKRAFDRLENADFGFRKKRAFDRIARGDFGLDRKKRSFDRLAYNEFGLMKRGDVDMDDEAAREKLIDNLASSIMALRHADAPLLVTPTDD